MRKTHLGSFEYKPGHTFFPFQAYNNELLWMVMSFKSNGKYTCEEENCRVSNYSVIASTPEEAVREAFKSYERNKVK